jgi:hypothetical protein
MKCVKQITTGHISRYTNDAAASVVKAGTHKYCPQGAYKAQERGNAKK